MARYAATALGILVACGLAACTPSATRGGTAAPGATTAPPPTTVITTPSPGIAPTNEPTPGSGSNTFTSVPAPAPSLGAASSTTSAVSQAPTGVHGIGGSHVVRGPAGVVLAYYQAIGTGNYERAWALGGFHLVRSYAAFVAQYADNAGNSVEIVRVSGNTVAVRVTTVRSNGSRQSYTGTYTVVGSMIVGSRLRLTGSHGQPWTGYPVVRRGEYCSPVGALGRAADGARLACVVEPPGDEARWE